MHGIPPPPSSGLTELIRHGFPRPHLVLYQYEGSARLVCTQTRHAQSDANVRRTPRPLQFLPLSGMKESDWHQHEKMSIWHTRQRFSWQRRATIKPGVVLCIIQTPATRSFPRQASMQHLVATSTPFSTSTRDFKDPNLGCSGFRVLGVM